MATASSSGDNVMCDEDRKFLRKNRVFLMDNLDVDEVLLYMADCLDERSEEKIKAEPTKQKKVQQLLELLPRRGSHAFTSFLVATHKVQDWLAKQLAEKRGVDLNSILTDHDTKIAAEGQLCDGAMTRDQREVLRKYLPEFMKKLNVEKMVASLQKAQIMKGERQSKKVLEKETNDEQVKALIDLLPKLGPKAFGAFFDALKLNQPQFAHDIQQSIKQDHPNVFVRSESHQESSNADTEACVSNQKYTLSTPCSELPNEVLELTERCLNKHNEVLENDWRRFYTVLKLPEDKRNKIEEKNDNPTRYVMSNWIARDGKKATVKKFLEALKECEQAGLAHKIEQMLGVELKDENDLTDGIANVHLRQENERTSTIRMVKDIPPDLKLQFINRLKVVENDVLASMATAMKEERSYVRDSEDFLGKIAECKIRILFRQLGKENQHEIRLWMREKFPEGSTGPIKSNDELLAGEMSYGCYKKITDVCTANDYWEILAGHKDIDLNPTVVALIKKKTRSGEDPTDKVLSTWQARKNSTVGALYDLLVDCELNKIADLL